VGAMDLNLCDMAIGSAKGSPWTFDSRNPRLPHFSSIAPSMIASTKNFPHFSLCFHRSLGYSLQKWMP
jgi:hypothetical protein